MFSRGYFVISAGKGCSSIASATYRSGEKLFDNQEGRHYLVFDQENRFSNGIEHCYYLGMLPMVILSPFVGPMVDRWNKKGLLIFPDVLLPVSLLFFPYPERSFMYFHFGSFLFHY